VSENPPSPRWRHDLKNQLGIVLGYSELILQDLDQNHPLRADLEEILRAAQQAMELIAQFDTAD
jgi:hypothetical protein